MSPELHPVFISGFTVFQPRTPNPRTFLANPRQEKFFVLRAAHFVLGLIKFYGTPLGVVCPKLSPLTKRLRGVLTERVQTDRIYCYQKIFLLLLLTNMEMIL